MHKTATSASSRKIGVEIPVLGNVGAIGVLLVNRRADVTMMQEVRTGGVIIIGVGVEMEMRTLGVGARVEMVLNFVGRRNGWVTVPLSLRREVENR